MSLDIGFATVTRSRGGSIGRSFGGSGAGGGWRTRCPRGREYSEACTGLLGGGACRISVVFCDRFPPIFAAPDARTGGSMYGETTRKGSGGGEPGRGGGAGRARTAASSGSTAGARTLGGGGRRGSEDARTVPGWLSVAVGAGATTWRGGGGRLIMPPPSSARPGSARRCACRGDPGWWVRSRSELRS